MNWSIRQKILVSFVLVVAAMAVMGGVTYERLRLIEQQAVSMHTRSLPETSLSAQILGAFDENFSLTQELVMQESKAAFDEVQAELAQNQVRVEQLTTELETIIDPGEERDQLETIKSLLGPYMQVQREVQRLAANLMSPEARALLRARLGTEYEKVHQALKSMVDMHRVEADNSAEAILASVGSAKAAIVICLAVAMLLALASGTYLLQAVTRPVNWLVGVLDAVRQGDFTQRVDRRDEFGTLATGFNRMADELAGLVGQVQKSGIQVNTSVTEIAATAREQQATASEIAATTTEIGATSKEISATSKELVRR